MLFLSIIPRTAAYNKTVHCRGFSQVLLFFSAARSSVSARIVPLYCHKQRASAYTGKPLETAAAFSKAR
jgi:hypothetical protein